MTNTPLTQRIQTLKQAEVLLAEPLERACEHLVNTVVGGGKILICSDESARMIAQAITQRLVYPDSIDRPPMPACLLNNDFNDNEYPLHVGQIQALAQENDLLVCCVGGKDSSLLAAVIEEAHNQAMPVLLITNNGASEMHHLETQDVQLCVPAANSPSIQELQLILAHSLCETVDEQLFSPPTGA